MTSPSLAPGKIYWSVQVSDRHDAALILAIIPNFIFRKTNHHLILVYKVWQSLFLELAFIKWVIGMFKTEIRLL